MDSTFFKGYIFLSGFNAYILIALFGIDIRCLNVMTLNRKHSIMWSTQAIKVCFNQIYGVNLAQAAEKVHASPLNWKKKGLIRREKELQEGRWTYRLYPKRLPASIETIVDCPCLLCPDNARCDPTTALSPKSCPKLTDWILGLGKDRQPPLTPAIPSASQAHTEDDSRCRKLGSKIENANTTTKKPKKKTTAPEPHTS